MQQNCHPPKVSPYADNSVRSGFSHHVYWPDKTTIMSIIGQTKPQSCQSCLDMSNTCQMEKLEVDTNKQTEQEQNRNRTEQSQY